MIHDVAQAEGVTPADVAQVVQQGMSVASSPEAHIEKTIAIPQSVSFEDYEEVKTMWMNHYEEGDVPVSQTITGREEWVSQEIVFITNTLNKLLSDDEKLRQEGLEELGYLLPIFLINNLKGEELLVYLKAKLEAAKSIHKILEREGKLREKMQQEKDTEEDTEVFVERQASQEEDKHMEMEDEQEEKTPQSIEDRVKAVQEKLSSLEGEQDTAPNGNLDDLKNTLKEKADSDTIDR